jgi:1-deoxy-D-xylulose-5-phosphate synthase
LSDFTLLKTIADIEAFRKMPVTAYKKLASEIREFLLETIPKTGGHLASSLGAVELTMALHHCFHSPDDKIIWDVGHQCYTHKILTGRKDLFGSLRQFKGISGFPKRSESEHDIMDTGHSSTSVSAALGFALSAGRNSPNRAIAVIGDGSLTGGMAFEALNHGGHLGVPFIVVINDNEMSISKNIGALSLYLAELTSRNRNFHFLKKKAMQIISIVMKRLMGRSSRTAPRNVPGKNLFHMLGYDYIGVVDGHDLDDLIVSLNKARRSKRPVIVHVRTIKGKGSLAAESNPTRYHGMSAAVASMEKIETADKISYSDAFGEKLLGLAKADRRIVAVTAAMIDGTGLKPFAMAFPERLVDTGITEQHAVTLSSGLALSGKRPVVAIYSSFMQRAVDQVIHDVCLQKAPVIFAVDRAGLVGNDGETHQGVFDIVLFRCVPNLVFVAPSGRRELEACLDFGLELGQPFMFRFPRGNCIPDYEGTQEPLVLGRGVFLRNRDSDCLIVGVGPLVQECLAASDRLLASGYSADVFNLRFIRPIDTESLKKIFKGYSLVVFVEDGVVHGGIGQELSLIASACGCHGVTLGLPDNFIEQGSIEQLKELCGISASSIYHAILANASTLKRLVPDEIRKAL